MAYKYIENVVDSFINRNSSDKSERSAHYYANSKRLKSYDTVMAVWKINPETLNEEIYINATKYSRTTSCLTIHLVKEAERLHIPYHFINNFELFIRYAL